MQTLVNLGLSIHYSRHMLQQLLLLKEAAVLSLLDADESLRAGLYRFLKLSVFRAAPEQEKSRRKLLKLLITDCRDAMRTQLIDAVIVELRTAAHNTQYFN